MSKQEQKLTEVSSVDGVGNRTGEEAEQMVPVSESIKYRKRAQTAEQQVEYLTGQLEKSQQQQESISRQYEESIRENELTAQLAQAGVIDVEAGLLLARKKLGSSEEDTSVNSVIEQMQKERPYLFGQENTTANLSGLTAGVRSGKNVSRNALDNLAHKAQNSGSRQDMQQYLTMRRAVSL